MDLKIEKYETAEQPTLCIRATCKVEELPQLIGPSYGKIMQRMGQLGGQLAGEPYVAYFNMDMQNLQIEMGFPVDKALAGQGEILSGSIPAGAKLTTLYTGPYTEMAPAYEQMGQYAKNHGLEPTGVVYEHYLNGPETPPEQLQTRIVFLLK